MSQFDLSSLFKQAQALQEKFQQMQDEAAEKTVEASSGGGMIHVIVDGALNVRKLEIDPALLAANDKTMLEDLITVAVNEGVKRARDLMASEVGKLGPLAGLKIPGMGGD